jgi:hypothetical protein
MKDVFSLPDELCQKIERTIAMQTENMNLKPARNSTTIDVPGFPVGYYQLHPDTSLNWQMNRFYNWANDDSMLSEMRTVAPSIHTYTDYTREFMNLAEQALARGQNFKAAYYLRAAEFFMWPSDPAKLRTRARYLSLVREHYDLGQSDLISIPYEHGSLPAYRFIPANSKGTLVLFGGFDGYIEELFGMCLAFRHSLSARFNAKRHSYVLGRKDNSCLVFF